MSKHKFYHQETHAKFKSKDLELIRRDQTYSFDLNPKRVRSHNAQRNQLNPNTKNENNNLYNLYIFLINRPRLTSLIVFTLVLYTSVPAYIIMQHNKLKELDTNASSCKP